MAEFISIGTIIAAWLSAVAALFVVWQNRKQWTASYRPELVLVRTSVSLEPFEKPEELAQAADDKYNPQVKIPIVNIGLGPAKDLKVSWIFPISQAVSSVNCAAQDSLGHACYEFENGWLLKNSGKRMRIQWKVDKEAVFDYILPVATLQTPPDQLRLPMAYIALLTGHYHFALKSQSCDTSGFPNLECQLKYLDIGGRKHSVNLVIAVDPVVISSLEIKAVVQSSLR